MNYEEKTKPDCTTCTNNKGCVTCENGELYESDDLKEEINNFLEKHKMMGYMFVDIARHFAEWQKNKMMKNAIDAEICRKYSTNQLCVTSEPFENDIFKFGDKVKVIILKGN